MAYETSNPPRKIADSVGANDGALWMYVDDDVLASVQAADYFSNGDDLGMKVGDVLILSDVTTPLGSVTVVSAVTAGGAATVV